MTLFPLNSLLEVLQLLHALLVSKDNPLELPVLSFAYGLLSSYNIRILPWVSSLLMTLSLTVTLSSVFQLPLRSNGNNPPIQQSSF